MLRHPTNRLARMCEWAGRTASESLRLMAMVGVGYVPFAILVATHKGDWSFLVTAPFVIVPAVLLGSPLYVASVKVASMMMFRPDAPQRWVNGRTLLEVVADVETGDFFCLTIGGRLYLTDAEIAFVPSVFRPTGKPWRVEDAVNVPYGEIAAVKFVQRWLWCSGCRVIRKSGDEEVFYFEQANAVTAEIYRQLVDFRSIVQQCCHGPDHEMSRDRTH